MPFTKLACVTQQVVLHIRLLRMSPGTNQHMFKHDQTRGAKHPPEAAFNARVKGALLELQRALPSMPAKGAPLFLDDLHRPTSERGRLGPYALCGVIQRTQSSVIYRARRLGRRNQVALKVAAPRIENAEDYLGRFRHEVSVLSKLRHPGIARLIEAGQAGATPFCATALILGPGGQPAQNLEALLRCQDVPVPVAVRYVHRLACTLQWLHDRGVVHGDVSLANILIDRHNRPRLIDFNASVLMPLGGEEQPVFQPRGTIGFAPPELWSRPFANIGPHTDIYGLGAVLYWLLANRPPNLWRDFVAPPKGPHSPYKGLIERLSGQIPRPLEDILTKCLDQDPKRRFQNARSVAEALAIASREIGGRRRRT
jgi:serine/threonine protein kinase